MTDSANSPSGAPVVGVAAALLASKDPSLKPRATLFTQEFSLANRVAVISGGNRGLGLEMGLALAEAGAAVYCLDLPAEPGAEFAATQKWASEMGTGGRLEYISADVTKQEELWKIVEGIANKEGRMDVCIAAAGILRSEKNCLEYDAKGFNEVRIIRIRLVYSRL